MYKEQSNHWFLWKIVVFHVQLNVHMWQTIKSKPSQSQAKISLISFTCRQSKAIFLSDFLIRCISAKLQKSTKNFATIARFARNGQTLNNELEPIF